MQVRTAVPGRGNVLYPLAPAAPRLGAAFFDGVLDVALAAACWGLCTLGGLTYGAAAAVSAACLAAIMALHHAVVPFLTNGYTLFRLAFKIKLVSVRPRRTYGARLLLHDAGVWAHFAALSLALAATAACLPAADQEGFLSAVAGGTAPADAGQATAAECFQALYAAAGVFSAILFVHGVAVGARPWLADKMSGTLMIRADRGTAEAGGGAKRAAPGKKDWTLPGSDR